MAAAPLYPKIQCLKCCEWGHKKVDYPREDPARPSYRAQRSFPPQGQVFYNQNNQRAQIGSRGGGRNSRGEHEN